MNRKEEIEYQQLDFVTSDLDRQKELLHFGFELEYHNSIGSCECLEECECDLDRQKERLDFYDLYDEEAILEAQSVARDEVQKDSWFIEDFFEDTEIKRHSKGYKKRLRKNFLKAKEKVWEEASLRGTLDNIKSGSWWSKDRYSAVRLTRAVASTDREVKDFFKKAQIKRLEHLIDTHPEINSLYDYINDEDLNTSGLDIDCLSDAAHEWVTEDFDYSPYAHSDEYLLREGLIECECGCESDCECETLSREELIKNCERMESGTDSTVRGGEIRTTGGRTQEECLSELNTVISNFESASSPLEVDEGCSFHIHAKLGDIRHSFGKNLHSFLYEFLLWNIDLLPLSVIHRLESGNSYIKPNIAVDEKYNLIHFHSQGTIEFRLFGNIDSIEDASKCFDFVRKSLVYAYTKKLNGEKPTLDQEYIKEELEGLPEVRNSESESHKNIIESNNISF